MSGRDGRNTVASKPPQALPVVPGAGRITAAPVPALKAGLALAGGGPLGAIYEIGAVTALLVLSRVHDRQLADLERATPRANATPG